METKLMSAGLIILGMLLSQAVRAFFGNTMAIVFALVVVGIAVAIEIRRVRV